LHFEIERTIEDEEEEENCCALHNSWTVKLSNPRFAQEYNVHNGGLTRLKSQTNECYKRRPARASTAGAQHGANDVKRISRLLIRSSFLSFFFLFLLFFFSFSLPLSLHSLAGSRPTTMLCVMVFFFLLLLFFLVGRSVDGDGR
jgi:hypothetical protein